MATPGLFDLSSSTSYCVVEPAMQYMSCEGRYEISAEQEAYSQLYDEASSFSTAAAQTRYLLDIEDELSRNYLSLVGMAHASGSSARSSVHACPALDIGTGALHPSQDDIWLSSPLRLNFDYIEEPVYQIWDVRAHDRNVVSYEQYAALALRYPHDTHGATTPPPTCVAPRDLHGPGYEYMDAPATFSDHRESRRARRALRRDASSSSSTPPPTTRRAPAQTGPIVPGFNSLKRRNVQVATSSPAQIATPREPARSARSSVNPWKCPHCEFVQWNRRGPDFRRHVETHKGDSPEKLYLCCGVPLIEAADFGVPAAVLSEQSVWDFGGLFMVGGCRRTFSRKDAYMRHLNRRGGRCFGDPQAPYQPGNVARAA
ncbi:hypothetical protein OH76DRAFT_1481211 [Lentinus brumalis]|uniref:Uncharacterized protein n=1 Tax=Lentinus brumalis TaxID=2498619 RepID=A0A371DGQ1_9APHY|nr:hypothetical protein OH76DRAFT_1481211 [Polyporus brumalis]